MRQLWLFEDEGKREVQRRERLAASLKPNSAYEEVTNRMKPEGGSCWATTQVKVLSPEIHVVSEADTFQKVEGRSLIADRRGYENPTGSEAVARQQRDRVGTRETQSVPRRNVRVCDTKPIDGKVAQKMLWESDQPIVSRKPWKQGREKGLAAKLRDDRDTSSTHRGGQRKSTKLSSHSDRVRENPRVRYTSLAHKLTVDFLKKCFGELKKDRASGVDKVTVKEYEVNLEGNLRDLVQRLKRKRYRPQPVRRVYIGKTKGGKRPLGIPTVEDKVVQMALKRILEPIFEVDFLNVSYGFRPNRNCHQALDVLDKVIMTKPVNSIVDVDIDKFFDTVDHKWLMKFLRWRIADPNILRLIGRFLRAGVMEEGNYQQIDRGTPQGGILSPLLSNIYLHFCLDLWFEKVVKKGLMGHAKLVRYADDFVVSFQYTGEAEAFSEALRQRIGKFGLEVSEEKSRIIPFGRYPYYVAQKSGKRIETFDFLGFTHYCTKSRRGYFKLGRKTSKAKFRQRIKELNQWLKGVRNSVELKEWWEVLRLKLMGHYRYYGISGNMPEVRAYYKCATRLTFKWINRRSQKRSYNWEKFKRFLQYNPLPKPKIYHLTYTLSS